MLKVLVDAGQDGLQRNLGGPRSSARLLSNEYGGFPKIGGPNVVP